MHEGGWEVLPYVPSVMTPEWSDGKFVSILVDLEADPQGREYTVGMVTKNPNNSWTAYDCTRANDLGTTSLALGDRDTRIAAKNLVEECFRTPHIPRIT